jgi:hypothetical protein
LTSDSEPKLGSEDFERLDEFIRQFDDCDIEIRPDPSLWEQVDLAKSLLYYLREYKGLRRLQLESTKPSQERSQHGLRKMDEEIQEAATMLDYCITGVKTQGMVHPGSELPKKLKKRQEELTECREDNRKLSLQLLEYKNKLGLGS